MAIRTTDAAVIAILVSGKNYDGTTDLTAFILTASIVTDQVESCDAAGDSVLDAATLERIEAFLAAHFYAHADQLFLEKETGDAEAKFQSTTGEGFKSTQYGQSAIGIDFSGCLHDRTRGSSNKVSVNWVGTEYDC